MLGAVGRVGSVGRSSVKTGGGAIDRYPAYRAAIAARATTGVVAWGDNLGTFPDTAKAWRTTAAAETGGLYGSSWNGAFAMNAGTICRVVQHGLANKAIFDAQVAGGLELFVRTAPVSDRVLPAFTRNGFTSSDSGTPDSVSTFCTELIRFDPAQQKAFISNPSIGGAETEFTF